MYLTIFYRALYKAILLVFCIQGFLLSQGYSFVHTANSSNIISNWTVIDFALLNGAPTAIFLVTQNWNPPGGGGIYNNSPIGVWYNGSQWSVFNQDLAPMPEGAGFNIFYPLAGYSLHTATASNIISNWTVIDNPSLNGNPNAIFFITQNWNPPGGGGIYNNSPIGVWYDGSNWAIFNEDLAGMPQGAAFNIFIHAGNDDFVHIATTSNIVSKWTVIDNPSLNGNPNAIFFITQNWNPPGGGGIYNNSPTGVWYDGSNWAIFNQNGDPMPEGAAFNIYLAITNVLENEDQNDVVVERFQLKQNYPNPFNPSTTIKYEIPSESFVTLKVYDVLGKEVATLINEEKPAGSYEVDFDASRFVSGVYLYKLQVGSFVETKKMILMK